MLLNLKLQNFRQFTDKVIDFASGLTAVRAAPEKGKSTIIEGILYALVGTKGLADSLADVVTWGEADSSLKATLQFRLGQTYTLTRSKSGAELMFGDERVTGQTEVTKFVENLFGAKAEALVQLMVAKQGEVRGALSGGPSKAGELIEVLGDFALVDRVIDNIQARLPCGSTVVQDARLAGLEAQVVADVPAEPDPSEIARLSQRLNAAKVESEVAQATYTSIDADAAQKLLARVSQLGQSKASFQAQVASLEKQLAALDPSCTVTEAEIEALQEEVAAESDVRRRAAAWEVVRKLAEPSVVWDGDYASLLAEISKVESLIDSSRKEVARLKMLQVQKVAERITETSCGLCGKDLTDVPEVLAKNAAIAAALEPLTQEIALHEETAADAKADLAELQAVAALSNTRTAILAGVRDYVSIDTSTTPPKHIWLGGSVDVKPSRADELKVMKGKFHASRAVAGRELQLREQLGVARKSLQLEQDDLDACQAEFLPAQATLDSKTRAAGEVHRTTQAVNIAQSTYSAAERDYAVAKASFDQAVKLRDSLASQIAETKLELKTLKFNNALIKKLRTVRPQIADKLWGVVLASVGHYLTAIRGETSVVTREDAGFKVNGHGVSGGGLSGSAKDSLGLAVRLALTKTFLPNSKFLILDEPGAAMNDERESNMLGAIISAGFEQVILVTHSDVADSFSDQVVTL